METCLSGRKGHPAKVLTAQAVQEFESPRLRLMTGDRLLCTIAGLSPSQRSFLFCALFCNFYIFARVTVWQGHGLHGGGPAIPGMSLSVSGR